MTKRLIIGSHATELLTKCGIATFNYELTKNALNHPKVGGLRLNTLTRGTQIYRPERERYKWAETSISDPNIPKLLEKIKQDRDYWKRTGLFERIEIINHEYSIFRDKNGNDFLNPLLDGLKKLDIVTIFIPHTILNNPNRWGEDYGPIMREAVKKPDHIIAMTPSAIDMLEDKNLYEAPRENISYIPHGINRPIQTLNRQELKTQMKISSNEDAYLSGGLFSAGKMIEDPIKSFAQVLSGGYENFKYFVLGMVPKNESDQRHKKECIDLASKLELNPLSIGNGSEGKLEELTKYNLGPHKVIFFDAWFDDQDALKGKIMADATIIVNASDSQISSGELAKALEAGRIPISYASPIVNDMAKEGVGFSVKHGNVEELTKSIGFFAKKADRKRLELASIKQGTSMYWDKKVTDIIDIASAIVNKKEEDNRERKILGSNRYHKKE